MKPALNVNSKIASMPSLRELSSCHCGQELAPNSMDACKDRSSIDSMPPAKHLTCLSARSRFIGLFFTIVFCSQLEVIFSVMRHFRPTIFGIMWFTWRWYHFREEFPFSVEQCLHFFVFTRKGPLGFLRKTDTLSKVHFLSVSLGGRWPLVCKAFPTNAPLSHLRRCKNILKFVALPFLDPSYFLDGWLIPTIEQTEGFFLGC